MPNGAGYWECKRTTVQTGIDEKRLEGLLKEEHWEPFAVTMAQYGQYVYHLRRWVRLP